MFGLGVQCLSRQREGEPVRDHETLSHGHVQGVRVQGCFGGLGRGVMVFLSDIMHRLFSFRKSTLPQNCQLNILISNSKQSVDDFAVELTF